MSGRAAIFGVGLAASILPGPIMGTAAAQSPEQAYVDSIYDYCDAKKVAAVWNTSVDEAKVVIGRKILENNVSLLEQDIASTANQVRCDLSDIGLSYEDAEKLAAHWGRSVDDAKAKAMDLASQHGGGAFRQMMSGVI